MPGPYSFLSDPSMMEGLLSQIFRAAQRVAPGDQGVPMVPPATRVGYTEDVEVRARPAEAEELERAGAGTTVRAKAPTDAELEAAGAATTVRAKAPPPGGARPTGPSLGDLSQAHGGQAPPPGTLASASRQTSRPVTDLSPTGSPAEFNEAGEGALGPNIATSEQVPPAPAPSPPPPSDSSAPATSPRQAAEGGGGGPTMQFGTMAGGAAPSGATPSEEEINQQVSDLFSTLSLEDIVPPETLDQLRRAAHTEMSIGEIAAISALASVNPQLANAMLARKDQEKLTAQQTLIQLSTEVAKHNAETGRQRVIYERSKEDTHRARMRERYDTVQRIILSTKGKVGLDLQGQDLSQMSEEEWGALVTNLTGEAARVIALDDALKQTPRWGREIVRNGWTGGAEALRTLLKQRGIDTDDPLYDDVFGSLKDAAYHELERKKKDLSRLDAQIRNFESLMRTREGRLELDKQRAEDIQEGRVASSINSRMNSVARLMRARGEAEYWAQAFAQQAAQVDDADAKQKLMDASNRAFSFVDDYNRLILTLEDSLTASQFTIEDAFNRSWANVTSGRPDLGMAAFQSGDPKAIQETYWGLIGGMLEYVHPDQAGSPFGLSGPTFLNTIEELTEGLIRMQISDQFLQDTALHVQDKYGMQATPEAPPPATPPTAPPQPEGREEEMLRG